MSDNPFHQLATAIGQFAVDHVRRCETHTEHLAPTRVYLGRQDLKRLTGHRDSVMHFAYGLRRVAGLRVFKVDAERHFHLARDEKDLERDDG